MGCDIHIHSEVKIKGEWYHYGQPNCSRDYDLFEKMAGVRGKEKNAIAAPRGIPESATFITKFDSDHWGTDAHSHSWLSAQEIYELAVWSSARGPGCRDREWDRYLFGNHYSGFIQLPEERVEGVEDVRFVFWFDN